MTADRANRFAPAGNRPYTSFDEAAMLTRIGSDLRNLYGNVETAALPGDLLRLARLIDEKRQSPGRKGPRKSSAA